MTRDEIATLQEVCYELRGYTRQRYRAPNVHPAQRRDFEREERLVREALEILDPGKAHTHTRQTLIDTYCEERAQYSMPSHALKLMAEFAVRKCGGTIDEAAEVLAEHFAGKVVRDNECLHQGRCVVCGAPAPSREGDWEVSCSRECTERYVEEWVREVRERWKEERDEAL